VLRVHRNRAHARAGDTVDWAPERKRYPYLGTVIETEMEGKPPARIGHLDPDAEDLTQEQRQDIWFLHLAGKGDARSARYRRGRHPLLTAPGELTGCRLHQIRSEDSGKFGSGRGHRVIVQAPPFFIRG